MTRKPNIVILFADDQRFDTIGALENDEVYTPNLDRLVATGTTFTHAHIPSGTSGAVCMPSRAMLHTGRTLYHLEGAGQSIPTDHTMIGEALQQAGYRTFGTGKWHNGTDAYARAFTDGDEIMFGGMADHWNTPMCRFDPTGKYDNAQAWIIDPFQDNHISKRNVDHIHFGRHSTDIIADAACRFISDADEQTPFFAYVSFLAPHDPRTMPEKYRKMFDPETTRLPASFRSQHDFAFGVEGIRDETLAPYPRTEQEIRRHIAEYYAMIAHLDDAVGRVLDTLDSTEQRENTIIVFAGDNGLAVGRHGLMGKQNHYEHSIRVPLIFAGPGIPRDARRSEYAYLLDIFPTLCDLVSIDTPASVEGRSLTPAIEGSASVRDELFFGYIDTIRSVKDDRYKLIVYAADDENHVQLFDLREDPDELSDLSAVHPAMVRKLFARLQALSDDWGDRDSAWGGFWPRFEANGGIGV